MLFLGPVGFLFSDSKSGRFLGLLLLGSGGITLIAAVLGMQTLMKLSLSVFLIWILISYPLALLLSLIHIIGGKRP